MIVQTAPEGDAHFIITQTDHAHIAGDFADRWGADGFAAVEPQEQMRHVIRHHDDGWRDVDAHPLMDPATHLPYHTSRTPLHLLVNIGYRSPNMNEYQHAYCGLISSMHTWGLYHGRYGISDHHLIHTLPDEARPMFDDMLHSELERQERLKAIVRNDQRLAIYADDEYLMHNYRLLQFCDLLALYLHNNHRDSISEHTFSHVPTRPGEMIHVSTRQIEPGIIHLDPWPFNVREFTISTRGRYMRPIAHPEKMDLRDFLYNLPITHQTYTLRAV